MRQQQRIDQQQRKHHGGKIPFPAASKSHRYARHAQQQEIPERKCQLTHPLREGALFQNLCDYKCKSVCNEKCWIKQAKLMSEKPRSRAHRPLIGLGCFPGCQIAGYDEKELHSDIAARKNIASVMIQDNCACKHKTQKVDRAVASASYAASQSADFSDGTWLTLGKLKHCVLLKNRVYANRKQRAAFRNTSGIRQSTDRLWRRFYSVSDFETQTSVLQQNACYGRFDASRSIKSAAYCGVYSKKARCICRNGVRLPAF